MKSISAAVKYHLHLPSSSRHKTITIDRGLPQQTLGFQPQGINSISSQGLEIYHNTVVVTRAGKR